MRVGVGALLAGLGVTKIEGLVSESPAVVRAMPVSM
jgi:hypothetical protein